YGFLLDVLANQKDHAGAARAAREGKSVLRAANPTSWRELLVTASVLARCVRMAEEDTTLSGPKREELARAYGDEALVLLREAVGRGYRDARQLRGSVAFGALGPRADFQELVRRLEKP
ncbi:MAG: hypothetical protein L0Z62_19250, partial [Gemmataceae bacterium]|nr:hypothetical protein [Gemmataceae bacterium]